MTRTGKVGMNLAGSHRTSNSSEYVLSVVRLCREMGISERALERLADLPHSTWMRIKRTPDARVLRDTDAKLRGVLGHRLPVPEYDNERRRLKGLTNLPRFGHRAHMKVAQKKAAKTRKLKHPNIDQTHRAAISVAAKDRHRHHPEFGQALGAFQKSFAGRALTSLRLRLSWWAKVDRRTKSPRPLPRGRTDIPDRTTIRGWAIEYAASIGVHQADVLAVWEPWLEKVGLWSARGGNLATQRYQAFLQLRGEWPTTSTGRPKHGLWEEFERRVIQLEDQKAPDREALRRWIYVYCAATAIPTPTGSRPALR